MRDPANLDAAAAAIRRQTSGYLSTGRIFAVCAGPIKPDYPAIGALISAAYDRMTSAAGFLEICGRGRYEMQAEKLRSAARIIRTLREDPEISDILFNDAEALILGGLDGMGCHDSLTYDYPHSAADRRAHPDALRRASAER